MARLTKTVVKGAQHPGGKKGKHLVPDSEVPGFGLLIHPSGVKSFVVRTRTPSGGRKLVTIGPSTMDVEDARTRAGEIKVKIRNGESLREPLPEATVAAVAERFLTEYVPEYRKGTIKEDGFRMKKIVAAWGSRLMAEVRKSDAVELITRLKRKAPTNANRTLQLFRSMWVVAQEWDMIPEDLPNPVRGRRFPWHQEQPRRRVIEIVEKKVEGDITWTDLEEAILKEAHRTGERTLYHMVVILILTGARKSEMLRLHWRDVNWKEATVFIEKTKNGEDRVLELGPKGLMILREIQGLQRKTETISPWVFASPHNAAEHLEGYPKKVWNRVREQLGVLKGEKRLTMHDLRRSVGTSMFNDHDADMDTVRQALGHADISATREIYVIADQRRKKGLLAAHHKAV